MKRRTFASIPALMLLPTPALAAVHEADTPTLAAGTQPSAGLVGESHVVPTELESPGIVGGNLPVFWEQLASELDFPLAWGTSRIRDFRAWRGTARAKVEELLNQPRDATPFRPRIVDEVPADGYRQRIIEFNLTRHSRVRATMLVPNGKGPFPAALLLHDHGSKFDIGKEKLIRPWYDETRLASAQAWSTRFFSDRFVGNELVARGYAVACVDALGWGDRSGLVYENQQALASNFYNLGSSLSGLMAREDVRASAFLASLPEVDKRRIAAVGFSMGGYRAWQVGALSEHISATVAVCWMTTLKAMMVPGNNTLRGQSAYFLLHPGLYRHLDIPDVASIAAPKPTLVFAGATDTLFPAAGVEAAFRRMGEVWQSQRAMRQLHTKVWPDLGHVFVDRMQDEAYAWLDTWSARR